MKKLLLCSLVLLIIIGCSNGSATDSSDPGNSSGGSTGGSTDGGSTGGSVVDPNLPIYAQQVNGQVKIVWKELGINLTYTVCYTEDVSSNQWTSINTNVSDTSLMYKAPYGKSLYYGVSRFGSVSSTPESVVTEPFMLTANSSTSTVTVSGLKADNLQSTEGIMLTWTPLSGQTGVTYHIFRSEQRNEIGSEVGSVTGNTFNDTVANGLVSGKIYFYRILWSDSTTTLNLGSNSTQIEGFFYNVAVDSDEPDNNDRANITVDNVSEGITKPLIYKFGNTQDIDWIRYTVPAGNNHFITISGVATSNLVNIEMYLGGSESGVIISGNDQQLVAGNTYYFKVTPNNSLVNKDNYIEEYKINITTSF